VTMRSRSSTDSLRADYFIWAFVVSPLATALTSQEMPTACPRMSSANAAPTQVVQICLLRSRWRRQVVPQMLRLVLLTHRRGGEGNRHKGGLGARPHNHKTEADCSGHEGADFAPCVSEQMALRN
jgi:hypothetical protein